MANYGARVFHTGFLGTAAFNASGFSYQISSGVATLTAPSAGSITATQLPIVDYSNKPTAEIAKIMNSMSGVNPLKESQYIDDDDIILSIDNDFAADFFSAVGYNLQPGVTIPWVLLFLHQSAKDRLDGRYMAYSACVVKSVPIKLEVAGKLAIQIELTADGPMFYPALAQQTTP